MPPAGAQARADQVATLARIEHQRLISDELGRLIEEAAAEVDGIAFETDDASLVRVARREWEKARRVPADLRAEITRTCSLAEHAWVDAKETSDFPGFLPHLKRIVELKRRYAECFDGFDGFERPYDALLDDFEPGVTTAEVAVVLDRLRQGIRPLVAKLDGRGRSLTTPASTATSLSATRPSSPARWSPPSHCRRTPGAWTRPCTRLRPRSPRPTSGSRPGSKRATSAPRCGR